MALQDIFSTFNLSASGASAERFRMEVVANNIANAFSTRTPGGGPFRRQDVVFAAVLDERLRVGMPPGAEMLGGVRVEGVVDDLSELPRVFNPGHPDADQDGFVLMPNVKLPIELVNLITANRAYEANLKVAQALRQSIEQALTLGRV
jgi:flagellar basal-body rod protein FlgC